eukprot:11484386-Karenia_brevis.AAC.1
MINTEIWIACHLALQRANNYVGFHSKPGQHIRLPAKHTYCTKASTRLNMPGKTLGETFRDI